MKIIDENERIKRKPVKRRLFVDECKPTKDDKIWKKRNRRIISPYGSLLSKKNEISTKLQVRYEHNGEWEPRGDEQLGFAEFEMLSDDSDRVSSDDSFEIRGKRKAHRTKNKVKKERKEKLHTEEACSKQDFGDFRNPTFTTPEKSRRCELDEDLTLKEDNLPWLLNFRVDNLFDENDATSINHDHSYEQRQNGMKTYPPNSNLILVMGQYSESQKRIRNKPPYTYTELIEFALNEKKESTVAGIYEWIGEHFPFYRDSDERWKNSIRHNLSINPHFKKGRKTETGSHLWKVVVNEEVGNRKPLQLSCRSHWKKQKLHELKSRIPLLFENTETTTNQNQSQEYTANNWNSVHTNINSPSSVSLVQSARNILYGEPEQRVQVVTTSHHVVYGDIVPQTWCIEWTPHGYGQSSEFLNPVPITEVVQECGLVTDSLSNQTVVSLPTGTFSTEYLTEPTDSELFEFIQPLATP